jgi:hypothetical protein
MLIGGEEQVNFMNFNWLKILILEELEENEDELFFSSSLN